MTRANVGSQDYRIFVGAFPSGEWAARIQALRLSHDAKTAQITAPHVTLAGTYWRRGPATPENEAAAIDRLQAVQKRIQPFELLLGGVASFLPRIPVVYLQVESNAGLLAARRVLLEALGNDKQRPFTPHLTLTMRLPRDTTQALLTQLQASDWHSGRWVVPIQQLWLMQRGSEDAAWRYIYEINVSRG